MNFSLIGIIKLVQDCKDYLCTIPNKAIPLKYLQNHNYKETMNYKKIFQIGLIKTLRFNFHYFGLKGLKLPVLISRYTRLSKLGGVVIANCTSPGCIHIGFDGVSIFDVHHERAIWQNTGNITFEGSATLGQGTRISCKGNLKFGKRFRLTANSSIVCYDSIAFGDDSLISWNCSFMDTDIHKVLDVDGNIVNNNRPVRIGNRVWIGRNTTILKGTEIGSDNVVAAASVLTGQKIPESNQVIGSHGVILKS